MPKNRQKFVSAKNSGKENALILPGRHHCDCMASKHDLVANCLSCGRIVCEQEGSGPCWFCNELVFNQEETEILSRGSKKSDELRQKLMCNAWPEREKNHNQMLFEKFKSSLLFGNEAEISLTDKLQQNQEAAESNLARLVEFDRTATRRTKVIDDQRDYFSTGWMSGADRKLLEEKERQIREKRFAPRSQQKIELELDFAGRFQAPSLNGAASSRNATGMFVRDVTQQQFESGVELAEDELYGDRSCDDGEDGEGDTVGITENNNKTANSSAPVDIDEEKVDELRQIWDRSVEFRPIFDRKVEKTPTQANTSNSNQKQPINGQSQQKRSARVIQDEQSFATSGLAAGLQGGLDKGVCLSMHQPWASLLVAGIKRHEGRSWYSEHRGILWIASTAKPMDKEDEIEMKRFYMTRGFQETDFPSEYPSGCVLGCVNVLDCLAQQDYREAQSQQPDAQLESDSSFVFICAQPRMLKIQFPIKGRHKIYSLESNIHAAVKKCIRL